MLQQKLNAGETFDNPRAFLYRTADNFVKRRKTEIAKTAKHEIPFEYAENTAVTFERDYIAAADETDYDLLAQELIDSLPDDEKELYNLRYRDNKKIDEIAAALGISQAAATMRLKRLRDKVKQKIYEKGG